MKGRIALFAGYFVGAVLVTSWFTGVLQEADVFRFFRSSDPVHHDSAAAGSEEEGAKVSELGQQALPGQVQRPTVPLSQDQPPLTGLGTGFDRDQYRSFDKAQDRPQTVSKASPGVDAVNKVVEGKLAELNRLEERLRRLKEQGLAEEGLAQMRASRARAPKERDARQEAGIMKLAKLYEGMEPEAAASILGSLEKDLATNVLASMKDRQASKVLGAMNDRRARELSERLHAARPNRPNTGELNEQGDSARKGTDADR